MLRLYILFRRCLIEIAFDADEEILKGRIDIFVLQNQFWVILLESKITTISVMSALPQTLAYMMANPQPHKPIFGMMTNGDGIIFVKPTQENTLQYDISRVFSPAPLWNELHTVLQILKRIGQIIVPS